MTTKTDEQERAAFEAWYEKQMGEAPRIAEDMYTPFATACWEAYQAGRAALTAQSQETIAYVTRNEEGDPAMLFFDLNEARLYCNPDEEPEALVLAGPSRLNAASIQPELVAVALAACDAVDDLIEKWYATRESGCLPNQVVRAKGASKLLRAIALEA